MTLTTLSCDGPFEGYSCPEDAAQVHHYPLSVAMRLARRAGWRIDDMTVCPSCVSTGIPVGAPEPAPLRSTGFVAAR